SSASTGPCKQVTNPAVSQFRSLRLAFTTFLTSTQSVSSSNYNNHGNIFPRDSGEHIQDEQGVLQYVPFLTCAETKNPLEFKYLSKEPVNFTVSRDITPFHFWEFYIPPDSPLTCRVPMRLTEGQVAGEGSESKNWIPLGIPLPSFLFFFFSFT